MPGARVLLAEGCDPATRFNMRHDGSTTDALIAKVGVAAKLTVRDGNGPPEFRSWMPFTGIAEPSPMRQNDPALTKEHGTSAPALEASVTVEIGTQIELALLD